MVSLETSQIKQIAKRFFHQSGLFKICPDTKSGMDGFSVSDLKFNYRRRLKIKFSKIPFKLIGDKETQDREIV